MLKCNKGILVFQGEKKVKPVNSKLTANLLKGIPQTETIAGWLVLSWVWTLFRTLHF